MTTKFDVRNKTVIDVLSTIGGLSSILFSVFTFIYSFYNKISFLVNTSN